MKTITLDQSEVITLTSALADYGDKVINDSRWCGCPNEAENLRDHAKECWKLRDNIEKQTN